MTHEINTEKGQNALASLIGQSLANPQRDIPIFVSEEDETAYYKEENRKQFRSPKKSNIAAKPGQKLSPEWQFMVDVGIDVF